jgi:hypothetical protein
MLNPAALPEIAGGQSTTGQMGTADVQELRKALEMGYGTDVAQLTGGGSLRIQSLERTMLSTIQENKHFALFNELAKSDATATVDEWTEQSGVGGRLGGSTNSESGNISSAQGQYARRVGMVKYLMTRREVSFVSTITNNIIEAEAVEARNGALQLLTDAEFLSFEGDSAVVSTEFDGIAALMKEGVTSGEVSGDNILDAQASSLSGIDLVNKAASTIAQYGNFGTPTHLFMSQKTQADFDSNLDPAFRVPLNDVPNGGMMLGSPVTGIRTSWGNIRAVNDVFVRDAPQLVPYEVIAPADAATYATLAPATVTVAAAANTASMFTAARSGNYYWFVTGLNSAGESTGTVTAQTAVAAGDAATLTITASAGNQETGYAIYRSRLNGTGAASDVRLMTRIPKTSGGTTTYVDQNREIPGTSKAYILNMATGAMAINWRQLLPMLKFPLYPTASAVVPWAQLMFGYLRVGKRRQHVVIKNVLPAGAGWLPFG